MHSDKPLKAVNVAVIFISFLVPAIATHLLPGFDYDKECWQNWSAYIAQNELPNAYDAPGNNYLPLYQYVLYLYGTIAGSEAAIRENIIYLRDVTLLFDFLGLWYVYKWAGKANFSVIVLISILNPAFLYNSLIWGQVDGILATLVFLAIYYSHRSRLILSAVFLTLAINMKLQAIVFLPVWGLLWLCAVAKARNLRTVLLPLLTIVATQFVVALPFIASDGGITQVWHVVTNSVGFFPKISMNAFNMWYWLVPDTAASDETIFIAGLTYKRAGLLMFFISSFFALLPLLIITTKKLFRHESKLQPSPELVWITSALVGLLFFFTNTQMHERYAHPVLIFLACYAFACRKWVPYLIFSLAYLLNLEGLLRVFRLNSYHTLIFDARFIAGLYALAIIVLWVYLYTAFRKVWLEKTA